METLGLEAMPASPDSSRPDTRVGTFPSPATSPGCPEPAISWLKGKPRAFKRPRVPQWLLYTQGQAARKPELPLDAGQRTGHAAGRVQTQESISRGERGGASSLGPVLTGERRTHKEGNAMRSGGGAHVGPPRTPERTTKNTAQPVLVSEPAEASARQHVRKPEMREHGHRRPRSSSHPQPCSLTLSGFSLMADSSWKRSTSQLFMNFSSYFPVRLLRTSTELTTGPLGLPHTHRFSGSELKGSALISNRLMTEPPGSVPDIPARTSAGERTGVDRTGWGPWIQEGDDHVFFGEHYHDEVLLKHHVKMSKLRQLTVSGQKPLS